MCDPENFVVVESLEWWFYLIYNPRYSIRLRPLCQSRYYRRSCLKKKSQHHCTVWSRLAANTTLSVDIFVSESQAGVKPVAGVPVERVFCSGSHCRTNICQTQGLNCCQCRALTSTSLVEVCACCPSVAECLFTSIFSNMKPTLS